MYRVLGLPRGRLDAVSRIRRGAGLFLYDFGSKHLYGPYRADSDGGLALEPAAFQGRFPAQIKFTIDGDFMPIPESSLRTAIKENYSHGKFSPELTFAQVEKLRALFRPITLLPESAPTHYVDDRHPAPPAAYLPPSASHPTQPAAYVHHPTAYVPPAAHLVPPEAYARPYSHLPPLTAQFTTPAYYATTTGYPYQAGYQAYGPLPATYQHVQAPPSWYLSAQYLSKNVPPPVYSTDPYYAAHQNDPYRLDTVKSHYQESTSERTAYGAAQEVVATNRQLVRHYGSIPSSETAAPEAAVTNLQLVRDSESTPSSAAAAPEACATNLQLVRSYGSEVNQSQQAVTYITHTAGTSAQRAASAIYSYAGAPATSQAENVAASSVFVVAAAPAYQ